MRRRPRRRSTTCDERGARETGHQASGRWRGLGEGGRRNRLEPNCGTPGVGAAMMLCGKKPTPSARSLQRPTYVQPTSNPVVRPTLLDALDPRGASFFELFVFTLMK